MLPGAFTDSVKVCGLGGLLCVLALVTGCAGPSPAQRQLLQDSRDAYSKRQDAKVIEQTSTLVSALDRSPEAAQALYLRGSSYLRTGRRSDAATDFQRCLRMDTDADATWRSAVGLGTIYYEDGRWSEATRPLALAAERMPDEKSRETVLLRLATSLERCGKWNDARRVWSELAQRYRFTEAGKAAQRRISRSAQHFSVQCGTFADRRNADRRAAELRKRSLDVRVEPDLSGSGNVVLVGRYGTYEEMLRYLGAVRQIVPDAVPWP